MKLSDATRRGLRTALQLLLTIASTSGFVVVLRALGVHVTDQQWTVATGLALPLITAGLNALEDAGAVKAFLKAPASNGADPVPPATPCPLFAVDGDHDCGQQHLTD